MLKGFNDTLDLLAFKWRMVPGVMGKMWIVIGVAAVGLLIYVSASTGSFIKQTLSLMPDSGEEKQTFLVLLKVFIDTSSGMMLGGIFWAILLGAIIMPLIGFRFGTLIPDGDLMGVTRNNDHQLSDSIFLQMMSSISLVQIFSLTALVSLFTVDADAPGYAILATWGLWLVAALFSVLCIWFLDWSLRRFGAKSKLVTLGAVLLTVAAILLIDFENALNFFGLAPKYIDFVQSLNSASLGPFLAWCGAVIVACFLLLAAISFMGTQALNLPEHVGKKNTNVPLFARFGLDRLNFISSMTQFITNTILQQPNIVKPLLFSLVFAVGLSFGLGGLIAMPALIAVMVSLAWTVNVFGVFGSGTTWLLSIYRGKDMLLGSVLKVHHSIVLTIALIVSLAVTLSGRVSIIEVTTFLFSSVAVSAVVAHSSLRQSIYSPHRFRVNVRGESIIPPAKALIVMFRLFLIGFITLGFMTIVNVFLATDAWYGPLVPALPALAVCVLTALRYRSLKSEWMTNDDIVKNIVKQVGV